MVSTMGPYYCVLLWQACSIVRFSIVLLTSYSHQARFHTRVVSTRTRLVDSLGWLLAELEDLEASTAWRDVCLTDFIASFKNV